MTEVRKYLLFSAYSILLLANMLYNCLLVSQCFLCISPSDCQVPEQSSQGTHGGGQPPQHTTGDDV